MSHWLPGSSILPYENSSLCLVACVEAANKKCYHIETMFNELLLLPSIDGDTIVRCGNFPGWLLFSSCEESGLRSQNCNFEWFTAPHVSLCSNRKTILCV